ncbi:MAG: hypothetical protein K940chlam7_01082, partial [Chlamydiae bacterium]|nr:hypothetical protein [Chlamydiota bacterium]
TLNHWLADEAAVDIWEIEDLRGEKSNVFCKLQKAGEWGYDTFETKDKLFDQLREDYGVFWKLEDPESYQTTYICYNTGLLGSSYDHVAHENLIYVADSLEFGAPNQATPSTSDQASWGKRIVACVLGGLLISAGRSWGSSQNSVSGAIATLKGTLGPAAFKTAFVFQMSMIAAVSRHEEGALPGVLLAGMMLLPEPVQGQSLCPQLVGTYDTPGQVHEVAVSGNYAYVADWASGLLIIDVSNVANPTLAGSYDTPGGALGVALSGNYAYVADYTAGLQIIDVANVANPTLAGSYVTPNAAWGVTISGRYAYVADQAFGLQIIDVANVANPTLAGSYDTPGEARGVAVSGNYAYVADYTAGLQIIDVANVANPTLAGSYVTPGRARGVAISGSYAYVADDQSGLQIIDVSNVTNPTFAGSYNTPAYARGVAISGNYVYVADVASGLQIIKIPCPSPTSSSTTTTTSSSTTRSSTSSSTTRSSTSSLASTLKSTTTLFPLSTDSTTTPPLFSSPRRGFLLQILPLFYGL